MPPPHMLNSFENTSGKLGLIFCDFKRPDFDDAKRGHFGILKLRIYHKPPKFDPFLPPDKYLWGSEAKTRFFPEF